MTKLLSSSLLAVLVAATVWGRGGSNPANLEGPLGQRPRVEPVRPPRPIASAGCGKAATKGVSMQTIDAAGWTRTYVLSVPDGYDGQTPHRVVFGYHGAGGNGASNRESLALESHGGPPTLFVYPDGINGIWDLTAAGIDVGMFDAVISALAADYCVDTAKIFATGFSYGGWAAEAIGCFRGDVVRAIASVAGGGPQVQVGCKGAVPVWILHGRADTAEPIVASEESRDFWIGKNACGSTTTAVTPPPCVRYQGCAAGKPVVWCAHEGGHEWPSYASKAIMDFFGSF